MVIAGNTPLFSLPKRMSLRFAKFVTRRTSCFVKKDCLNLSDSRLKRLVAGSTSPTSPSWFSKSVTSQLNASATRLPPTGRSCLLFSIQALTHSTFSVSGFSSIHGGLPVIQSNFSPLCQNLAPFFHLRYRRNRIRIFAYCVIQGI